MFDVFLSHAEEDAEIVERIYRILRSIETTAYTFERHPLRGLPLHETLRREISDCRVFVTFLTKHGIESQWVNQEIGAAYAFDKFILPIIETEKKSKGFIEIIGDIKYNPERPKDMIFDLIHTLRSALGKEREVQSFIKCKCACRFDILIPSCEEIVELLDDKKEVMIYSCPKCQRKVDVTLLTLEILSSENEQSIR
ncbi:MAG: toll/interleukin-1 receptor domain-containing protein [Nanoarchaeota archaeon]|nr:toll/interleukin-1 receptor domain-containing protein [Nanoarchaeota archaeon]